MIDALGARVHVLAQPRHRAPFIALFKDTLQCDARDLDFGLPLPITLVTFPDGSAFSVEFTDDAPERCSTWIEFRTRDLHGVHARLADAGVRRFSHAGSAHVYFEAPGGQIFRILDAEYQGP